MLEEEEEEEDFAPFGSTGLRELANLAHLTRVDLSFVNASLADGLAAMAHGSCCASLTTLELRAGHTRTIEEMRAVGALRSLTTLDLCDASFEPGALRELAPLTRLTRLYLFNCRTNVNRYGRVTRPAVRKENTTE